MPGYERCAGLDGKHFKVSEMEIGKNAPPLHPNCRCSIAPYEDSAEYDEWLDYLDNGGTTEEWEQRLQIQMPGNTKSFKRSLQDISEGRAGLDQRRKNILNRLQNEGDYHRFERGSISTRDLAYLSAAEGVEFALFRSKDHDILIRGNARDCNIAGNLGEEILKRKYEWVAHSHVDRGVPTASMADRKTLRRLDQKRSILPPISCLKNMPKMLKADGFHPMLDSLSIKKCINLSRKI
jgi:hypothetical protein